MTSGFLYATLRWAAAHAEAGGGLRPDLPTTRERGDQAPGAREFELLRAHEILKAASVFSQTERRRRPDGVTALSMGIASGFGGEPI